jgi:hypothetical protein
MAAPEHDLYAPVWTAAAERPQVTWSEILPGLYQGGTDDDDWISMPRPLDSGDEPRPFDAVVTLFAWAQPFGWGVTELRYGFADAHPRYADLSRVVEAARWAHGRWRAGDRVLVRCQAGLNRSGLVMALVLMLEGMSPAEAITLIRRQRSAVALCNDDFVDWLLADAAGALAAPLPPVAV